MEQLFGIMPVMFPTRRFQGLSSPLVEVYEQRQQQLAAVHLTAPLLDQHPALAPGSEPGPAAAAAAAGATNLVNFHEVAAAAKQQLLEHCAPAVTTSGTDPVAKAPALVCKQLHSRFKSMLLPEAPPAAPSHATHSAPQLLACTQQQVRAACSMLSSTPRHEQQQGGEGAAGLCCLELEVPAAPAAHTGQLLRQVRKLSNSI
jgi:hypothetical protein